MGTLGILLFFILLAKGASSSKPSSPAAPFVPPPSPAAPAEEAARAHQDAATVLTSQAQAQKQAAAAPVPWPQAMPAGLPPFPSGRWVPAQPPPPAVVTRAWQLLSTLWAHGAGTHKTEQTAGQWITYQAQPMGQKKGVVAWKLRGGGANA